MAFDGLWVRICGFWWLQGWILDGFFHPRKFNIFPVIPSGVPHFFLPPAAASSFLSQEMTLPSITTPFPSMKATRERPSQFLKLSQTSGCCGAKLHRESESEREREREREKDRATGRPNDQATERPSDRATERPNDRTSVALTIFITSRRTSTTDSWYCNRSS